MKIKVNRTHHGTDHTIGILYIDGKYQCFTLEDEARIHKVMGETRIPAGTYDIAFRKEGSFNGRYLAKYGKNWHKGMLEVQNVPNFKYILIHCGNDDDDTAGCLLVGETNTDFRNYIGSSRAAYRKIYPIIRDALLNGEKVTIEYIDK
ncbi:MAG: DUF5675 family protein [Leeuwenhoekiella sp.]